MELDLIAETEEQNKQLLFAMIDLAILDIRCDRGGRHRMAWADSALRWIKDIRPGDESHAFTFAGACITLGADPKKIQRAILSNVPGRKSSHYVGSTTKTRPSGPRSRTYYQSVAQKDYGCEYCGEEIQRGETYYYRHLAGATMRGHMECVNADTYNTITIKDAKKEAA